MKRVMSVVAICLAGWTAISQEPAIDKTAAGIPASLKENAVAVYRLDKASLAIHSASQYTLQVHQVVTILNEQGAHYLRHQLPFDKFYQVDEAVIQVYDALGALKKKYIKKDFEVEAAYDGISLVTDDKVMRLNTSAGGYPCTVEVQYKCKANGYIELPDWVINTHDAATERFVYEVTVPSAIDIRHRTKNLALTPVVEIIDNKKKYTWEAKNIGVKKLEADSYEPSHFLPRVEVAPNEFSYDGYPGSFRSWQSFGEWNYRLYEEKAPFTASRIAEIKSLISTAAGTKEKIGQLYQYLQRNMRYVSIQLGIGGFKPFPVRFVDEKRYGDCKALTNYMRNLLAVAGIRSYPALVNAGYNKVPVDASFPSSRFNHVILCVPAEKDTVWLECTSNTSKPGELGTFTENRKALLLTEQGGLLINTPQSSYESNQLFITSRIVLSPSGGAEVNSQVSAAGEVADWLQHVAQLSEGEQQEAAVKDLGLKASETFRFSASRDNSAAVLIGLGYDKLYDFSTGQKFFFPMGVTRLGHSLKPFARETDYVFRYAYIKRDTTYIQLPSNFSVETIPADKELSADYSTYKRSYTFDKGAGQIIAVRTLTIKKQVIPAQAYAKLVRFFKDVEALEEEAMILIRKEAPGF